MSRGFALDALPDLVAKVETAVVHVSVSTTTIIGAGFAIPVRPDDQTAGVIVTNAHVVEDDPGSVHFHAYGQEDQRVRTRLIDASTDLALLQLAEPATDVLPCRESDIRVGEPVIAIGSPLNYEASVSLGIVSALGRRGWGTDGVPFGGAIQTDAAINPGNSGGPLIDLQGSAIGINYAGRNDAQNISWAIPIGFALDIYAEICETGDHHIRRAVLGARTATHRFDAESMRRWQLPSGAGVLTDPRPGSPAHAAGLRAGDVILRLDGEEVPGSAALFRLLNRHLIGKKVKVEFARGRKLKHASLTPAERQN